ncbi:MAG: DUF2202 domain-containing protein [Lachnotalea sp.]
MMRKQIKTLAGAVLVAGLLVTGVTTKTTVYAANSESGSAAALADTNYSLEEMLTYAIEDEYLAQMEYSVIMKTFGEQRPFSNIINAEGVHINYLLPLLEEYNVTNPQKDYESLVEVPSSIDEAYLIGIQAEENNIAMYEQFLNEDLPDDMKLIFEELVNASQHHLLSFQRVSDRTENNGMGYNRTTDTNINTGIHSGLGVNSNSNTDTNSNTDSNSNSNTTHRDKDVEITTKDVSYIKFFYYEKSKREILTLLLFL